MIIVAALQISSVEVRRSKKYEGREQNLPATIDGGVTFDQLVLRGHFAPS
jgi:hypothetical protein